ncbi:MAG: hypothetical protein AAGU75_13130 [Bacillota bacterium]
MKKNIGFFLITILIVVISLYAGYAELMDKTENTTEAVLAPLEYSLDALENNEYSSEFNSQEAYEDSLKHIFDLAFSEVKLIDKGILGASVIIAGTVYVLYGRNKGDFIDSLFRFLRK